MIGARFSDTVNWVVTDNIGGCRALLQHLLLLGHSRIAMFVRNTVSFDQIERLEAYKEILKQQDIFVDDDLIVTPNESVKLALKRLMDLPERPTAIVSAGYDLVFEIMSVLSETGMAVPRDIAVACFGDYRLAKYYQPSLTALRVPAYEIGCTAMGIPS